ncbi:hypothetical protein REPUB_Repub09cG0109500 [Reevesia pubescens]
MHTCTEMVMPMTCSNDSMFPPSGFDYDEFAEQCQMKYGVLPRPHWITTQFGGQDPWSRGGVLKNISSISQPSSVAPLGQEMSNAHSVATVPTISNPASVGIIASREDVLTRVAALRRGAATTGFKRFLALTEADKDRKDGPFKKLFNA